MSNMIRFAILTALGVLSLIFNPVQAQFVNIEVEIDPEISAEVQQNLTFGDIVQNSGIQQIELGSPNMGVFSITGIEGTPIYISFEFPEYLEQELGDGLIPVNLNAAYNNSGEDNYRNATVIQGNSINLVLGESSEPTTGSSNWHKLFIYTFGQIEAENTPLGLYNADIVMVVNHN